MEYLDWNIPFWDKLDYSPLKYLAIGMAKAAPDPYSNSGVRLYVVPNSYIDVETSLKPRDTSVSSRGVVLPHVLRVQRYPQEGDESASGSGNA
jgi:hypothetical protein